MSTTKPRITITLEPHHHEVLSRAASASGESMSQIVANFVAAAVPSLERLVVVMERANTASEEVRSGLVASFDRAERQLMPVLVKALDQAEMFLGDVAEQAAAPRPDLSAQRTGRARETAKKAPAAASTPVPVTRGSGGGKTLTRGKRHGAL
jgi:uncharacterized protein (DUF1778 family)